MKRIVFIEDRSTGWLLEFFKTTDLHLQIIARPRTNESMNQKLCLYNCSNQQLRSIALQILSNVPDDDK